MTRAADPEGGTVLLQKAAALEARLAALGSVLVAYSGGVDSAFLAVTATRILGERARSEEHTSELRHCTPARMPSSA